MSFEEYWETVINGREEPPSLYAESLARAAWDAAKADCQTPLDTGPKLPELSISLHGSSGIEIRARLSENYNCGEFTLNSNPQPIFISPWMQFEPKKMSDERARIAHLIVHRATNYQRLLEELSSIQDRLERMREREDRFYKQQDSAFDMWRKDRKKMGLPEDFSDIKEWPPELMSNYV
jgi:hypothetical protein